MTDAKRIAEMHAMERGNTNPVCTCDVCIGERRARVEMVPGETYTIRGGAGDATVSVFWRSVPKGTPGAVKREGGAPQLWWIPVARIER